MKKIILFIILSFTLSFGQAVTKYQASLDKAQNGTLNYLVSAVELLLDSNKQLLELVEKGQILKNEKEFKEVKKFFRVIDVNEEYSYYICADNCGNNYRIITNEPVDKKLIGKKISISAELPALIGYEFKEEPRLR